jgi:sugar lactone lactonase YvrE
VTSLTPDISVSPKAGVNPSGLQDFTNPVQYTVTAEDGTKATYTVSITVLPPDATLEGIEPDNGPKGTMVNITGDNFGEDESKVKVYFNDIEATISDFTNSSIIAEVPPRAYTGLVKVVINDVELIGPTFDYTITEVNVTTFVGSTMPGTAEGIGTNARFRSPGGMTIGPDGMLYVADVGNGLIRKVSPDGMVTTVAGTTPGFLDGNIGVAQFQDPTDIVFDENGNMYVADASNHRIRKITPDGIVSTLAGSSQGYTDGPGTTALFDFPHQIILDSNNNLVISDSGSDKIRKITLEGVTSTIAGSNEGYADGMGTDAMFYTPLGLLEDENNELYVVDIYNNLIRKITEDGVVSTFAGSALGYMDGTIEEAQFFHPVGIDSDKYGALYVTDGRNRKIRKISTDGVVSTFAGTTQGYLDGPADSALFEFPSGIVIDSDGTIYVSDQGNNCIRKIIQE